MKRERDPTPEEFEKLLAWLDADRDVAGERYQKIHYRLIRIFVARGCADPETLSDEVMNRVATRIDKLVNAYHGDPAKCFHGFAENVHLEYRRGLREVSLSELIPQPEPPDERDPEKLEQEDECLELCMNQLSKADSELFRRYFQDEKQAKIQARKSLARELKTTANALRIKAHRLRRSLQRCMEECLKPFAGIETIPASNS